MLVNINNLTLVVYHARVIGEHKLIVVCGGERSAARGRCRLGPSLTR